MPIQLGPIMIPCRKCDARPGEDCMSSARRRVRDSDGFHRVRANDAKRVSALVDW